MVTELVPGANVAVPGDRVEFALPGPFDLSALVLGADGKVGGDADMVFYNQPSGLGVTLRGSALSVVPDRLRRGAARVVVLASPEASGLAFGSLPAPVLTVSGPDGRRFARFAPRLRTETAAQLAEVYPRAGRWRLRAIGQGYADGLSGLARDFGVDVEEPAPVAQPPAAGLPGEVVVATNAERARYGLTALSLDARLAAAAQGHCEDMIRRAFFSHGNPDGAQVWDRALARGYRYRKIAENIAAGQRTAAEVVRGWMDSPGHRANILDGELTQIGVGHALGGAYGVTWTQVFGIPL